MSDQSTRRGSEYVYDALVDAGVELLVGLPGTQTLPLDRAVAQREDMRYVMCRHETAIPHVAWGYREVSGRTAATLTVPGPGDTNAMHGLKNAAEDGVPILHVAADPAPEERGKGAIHEIDPESFDHAVKRNLNVDRPMELRETLARGIDAAHSRPTGPVRFGIPSTILDSEFAAPPVSVEGERTDYDTEGDVARAVEALAAADRPVVYAGGGTRRTAEGPRVVGDLADALDAPVVTSYKGKGVFPEDDARALGVTGSHTPAGARRVLDAADVVLAVGTDFDGVTTAHWELPMGEQLIHVNADPADVNAAYEADVAIVGDATAAGDAILDGLAGAGAGGWDGARVTSDVRAEYRDVLAERGLFEDGPGVPTPLALRTVREATPREAVVTTDVGGFRLWSMQAFEVYRPDRFVTAGSWAGMGVGLPSAIGGAIASDEPVVCLTGDGGLLMCIHELATAVEEGVDVTVVVSNNRDYGIISKSPAIEQYTDGHRFEWDSPDYVTIAEGFGCEAARAETADELREAAESFVGNGRPSLIDVSVPTEEPSAAEAAEYDSTVELA